MTGEYAKRAEPVNLESKKQAFEMVVLVAEDDATTRGMLAQYLKKKGLSVITAGDGEEALKIVENNAISIALLDWVMPGINGMEVVRRIREKESASYVYIIMLTAKEGSEDLLAGFEAGIDEYIQKPVNLRELYARVKVGMRIAGLEQALNEKQNRLYDLVHIKNKFIGIAAHDLRNPVISIRGFSELLLKNKSALTEEQREFISIIHSTSDNMLALLNDLLDLSQIESGKLDIKKTSGSLKKVIEERIRLHKLQADQKRTAINMDLKKLPDFDFDEQRISQAVDNLLTNAIKFSPPGTNINLTLRKDNGAAIFSVCDEGPGIPVEEQHMLFNEFQRLSIRPTGGESSTGLGLAIAKKIVEAHGGHIEFESHVGRGSIFSIVLPL